MIRYKDSEKLANNIVVLNTKLAAANVVIEEAEKAFREIGGMSSGLPEAWLARRMSAKIQKYREAGK